MYVLIISVLRKKDWKIHTDFCFEIVYAERRQEEENVGNERKLKIFQVNCD